MVYLCEYLTRPGGARTVRILECRGLDSLAVLPDVVNGCPVTELAPYLFAAHWDFGALPPENAFWWQDPAAGSVSASGQVSEAEWQQLPALRGVRLTELILPPHLERVGAYALYNCERLERLELYSTTLDWGAGVFTGCYGVKRLTIHVDEARKSCMREVLAELRQTLEVLYLPRRDGADPPASCARLILPEFFEEAVENTPARILVTETHGCGQKYRNAFVQTQFRFGEYDSLFPHVEVQEPETLVARLALGRLMYPYQLEEKYACRYRDYLTEHVVAAAEQVIKDDDMEALEWIFSHIPCGAGQMDRLLETAGEQKNGAAVSFLMDRKRAMGAVRRRHFSL